MAPPRKTDSNKSASKAVSAIDKLKVPPYSVEAEQSFLGALLLDNQAFDRITSLVVPDDFYRPEHRVIFKAIASLLAKDQPVDVLTLSHYLSQQGVLEGAGGLAYLAELAQHAPGISNVVAYGEIVRDRSICRHLLFVAHQIADRVFEPEGRTSQEILEIAEQEIFKLSAEHQSSQSGPQKLSDIVPSVVDKLDQLMQSKDGITGIASRYKDLDAMTSGLQGGDLVIIAGRPSMGKTTFAMNIAENVAMEAKKPVLVFSMEMPKESIMMRVLSSLGRVEQSALRSGKLNDHDWTKIFSTMSLVTERMNMYIDDTAALSPSDMRSRARRVAREHGGLSMIVVDYLQLMQVPGSSSDNRVNEVSEISRGLKALAKELSVPVVALSQLSRKCEERTDKRPLMADIRESGAIEQDADLILFVYRDEVYHPESQDKGIAEIIIGKQRNGPIGTLKLTFLGHFCRFDDYSAQRMM